ncbi:hypothetical protein C5167_040016 [Papaver somniferum]|uniref:VWFA domain-containing protein n=1 Tax=Papaver somniferum TaxID=3469 RepID=A0A4Y7IDR0_PAPSO|nr:probable E3 ubiquitin-protein ligase WAVH2 [Papaver somniferum]RZC47077.1 hypothetical protein C5167_040016 [Papaver somniferum]
MIVEDKSIHSVKRKKIRESSSFTKMMYNDDEQILKQINTTEEEAYIELDDGLAEVRIINKQVAPLEESPFKVLLEVNGLGSYEGRLPVDLVTVLDIGDSMKGSQIAKAKLSIMFLLHKLSYVDRLSIVTFSKEADRLCPLRQITESSRMEIANQVNALETGSSTNVGAGFKMALKILSDRTCTKSRRAAIILISNGIEDDDSDAANVPVGKFPVHTFGLGSDCDSEVLAAIARKSDGGIFAMVPDLVPLSAVFSKSLADLLDVVMEDLTLIITPENGYNITEVGSVNYHQQTKGGETDPVIVAFGSFCNRETCRVILKLTLPKVEKRCSTNIFKICYMFRVVGEETSKSDERTIDVVRDAISGEDEIEEVLAEEKRIGSTYNIRGFALVVEPSPKPERDLPVGIPSGYDIPLMVEYKEQAATYSRDPSEEAIEDRVMEASPIPEDPKKEGWRFGRLKQVVDLGYNIADKLKEHDPRATFSGKKIKALAYTSRSGN